MKHYHDRTYKTFLKSFLMKSPKENEKLAYQQMKTEIEEDEYSEIMHINHKINIYTIISVVFVYIIQTISISTMTIFVFLYIAPKLILKIDTLIYSRRDNQGYSYYIKFYNIYLIYSTIITIVYITLICIKISS